MPDPAPRPVSLRPLDEKAVQALVQAAVDVELFTIPLYMSTLYSVFGTYQANPGDTALWPGVRPAKVAWKKGDPLDSKTANQLAFNVIFTVYIQEMLHLQMASNLARAVGVSAAFSMPTYSGSVIPCVGDLKTLPGYEDVTIAIRDLCDMQLRLFIAIEMPDWTQGVQPPPAVPLADFDPPATAKTPSELANYLPTFGTIGHLYSSIASYLHLKYADGQTLWEAMYQSGAPQVEMFVYGGKKQYPKLRTTIDTTLSASAALSEALDLIDGIVAQGEGGSASQKRVPEKDQPDPDFQDPDWAGGAIGTALDAISHYKRFKSIRKHLLPSIVTFGTWRANRGASPWQGSDLTSASTVAPNDTARAAALNLAETGQEAAEALNQSVVNLLAVLEKAWSSNATSVPLPSMQAIFTRVATTWAAGATPSFQATTPAPVSPTDPHACQGLSIENPGNACAAIPVGGFAGAVIHTCGGMNSCKGQGGCGWPTAPDNQGPGVNSAAGNGGCGAPIPASQVMHQAGQTTFRDVNGRSHDVAYQKGDSISSLAWKIYCLRTGVAGVTDQTPLDQLTGIPTPTDLRLVLPPS